MVHEMCFDRNKRRVGRKSEYEGGYGVYLGRLPMDLQLVALVPRMALARIHVVTLARRSEVQELDFIDVLKGSPLFIFIYLLRERQGES